MRRLLFASFAVVGLASSTFASNAFAAPGDAPDMAQIERLQERHALLLDAHLAAMKAGLKLTDEQAKNWPAFETAIREAERGARIDGAKRESAWPAANAPRQSNA